MCMNWFEVWTKRRALILQFLQLRQLLTDICTLLEVAACGVSNMQWWAWIKGCSESYHDTKTVLGEVEAFWSLHPDNGLLLTNYYACLRTTIASPHVSSLFWLDHQLDSKEEIMYACAYVQFCINDLSRDVPLSIMAHDDKQHTFFSPPMVWAGWCITNGICALNPWR